MAYFPVRRSVFDSSKHFLVLPALLLAGAALLAGCHPAVTDPNDPKFIVAEKGKWQITRAELNTEVASILKQYQATPEQIGLSKMPIVETKALKNMVLKKLVMDKAATLQLKDVDKDEAAQLDAVKQSIPPGKTFEQQLKEAGLTLDDLKKVIHERVIVRKVLDAEAFKNDDATDQEINDFYLKNKESITAPPQVRASRILVHVNEKATPAEKAADKKAIDKAHDRVVHGEDFSKVATEVSQDQSSKSNGGDIGLFKRGDNPDAGFDDVAFNTKLGVVSPVFQTSLGYQFLKVTDIKPGGQVPLADVRPKISAYMRDQKMKKQSQDYLEKLLADSGVVYHMKLVEPPAPNAAAGPGEPAGAPPSASVSTPPVQAAPAPAAKPSAPAGTK
jgi:parvulin-like peptidyl-prolyl isomerase